MKSLFDFNDRAETTRAAQSLCFSQDTHGSTSKDENWLGAGAGHQS
ncbi:MULTISPECIES: hypothetical protein [Mesobacillus]|nr:MULTISPECIES: hypothetical protein [Mesobacillus]MCM3572949.1 hypothetical protein [Mesobacillus subterraneus]UYZ23446.1 hypothetical protein FOF60_07870 [Mesobacillus jeotgali]